MAKAVTTLKSGLTVGYAFLGQHSGGRGSVAQQVHDGDTMVLEAAGNLSFRFLGIDTPEVSFTLPGGNQFLSIGGDRWQRFLEDPFNGAPAEFIDSLGPGLKNHLASAAGPGCAENHAGYAGAAHRKLEALVETDMRILGQGRDRFRFFMAFAHEVMDRYGRFLGFINRYQDNEDDPEPRPRPYNERLLEAALACPYFIWPNVNPFRRNASITDAVPLPGELADIADGKNALGPAREWVRKARQSGAGLFQADDPLRLEPFELRILARRQPPGRWVVDLSNPASNLLVHPVNYYTVPNSEDRLFVPPEYVPLFAEKGWQTQSW